MRTTIDSAGRIVIPKDIRKAAGLGAGSEVDIEVDDEGRISVQLAPIEVKLVKRGKLTVMMPTKPVPKMTQADVNRTLRRIRNRKVW